MITLNALERRAVDNLLSWDRTRRKADLFAAYFSLVLGGVLVIFVTSYTVAHLQDGTAYTITRLGFLAAIVFFLVYAFVSHRVRERHQLATILRKLTDRRLGGTQTRTVKLGIPKTRGPMPRPVADGPSTRRC